ncbi:hypothetical protein B9J07_18065 [Sinorhizobium sp. LM21]|nr:hypothetical protein B9J07_18065 [Sinorhizobium sp. LM21]
MAGFKVGLIAAIFASSFSGAAAQTVMDGSDAALVPKVAKAMLAAVTSQLVDPYSAQFDKLRPWETDAGSICGRVNAKNGMGGYAGFQPFRYIIAQDTAYIHANTGCK